MLEALTGLLSTQRNKPLSIVMAVIALFGPSSLTIFLARPELFASLGLNGVLLLSATISAPIILLCYSIWWTPLSALLKIVRALQGHPPETDMLRAMTAEDPLEWPCLLAGAWSANLVLFVIATVAYSQPIRIGATFLFTAGILFGLWFIVLISTTALDAWLRRKLKAKLEELVKAMEGVTAGQSDASGAA
jgi:hypothetical protein